MIRRPVRRMARVAAGTAVMAGTAGYVHHRQQQRWNAQEQAQSDQQQNAYQQGVADAQAAAAQQASLQQQTAANQPAPQQAVPQKDEMTQQLEQLAELKNKGILSEEEFLAKKKQILGI